MVNTLKRDETNRSSPADSLKLLFELDSVQLGGVVLGSAEWRCNLPELQASIPWISQRHTCFGSF